MSTPNPPAVEVTEIPIRCEPDPSIEMGILPYSLEAVPVECLDWQVRIDYEQKTYDGVAFGATLIVDGKPIGTIREEGRGGGTWFATNDRAGQALFDAAVDRLIASGVESFLTHESLCNRLYENAAMFRDMNRKRKAMVLLSDFAVHQFGTDPETGEWFERSPDFRQLNKPLDDAGREYLRKTFPGCRVWVKGQGWEVLSA